MILLTSILNSGCSARLIENERLDLKSINLPVQIVITATNDDINEAGRELINQFIKLKAFYTRHVKND